MLEARARALLQREVCKGCSSDIFPVPVGLEPSYHPISKLPELSKSEAYSDSIPESVSPPLELKRAQIWLSPEEEFSWLKSELFLKHLQHISYRAGFEIAGNRKEIQMRFLTHREDLPIVLTAFRGQFVRCELSECTHDLLARITPDAWLDIAFLEAFPPPPYSRLLTRPEELKVTTYRSLIAALMEIEPPAIGFYQALFQPVHPNHDWNRNVQGLLDLEYNTKLV
jgi:hypothetical protein